MTSSPDSASGTNLEAGLAAIKQGNYPLAIQQLERYLVSQAGALEQPDSIKARMWLATVYVRSGQPKKAIAVCQQLRDSPNAKLREWASQTLEEIEQRYPTLGKGTNSDAEAADLAGFVPLQSEASGTRSVFIPPTKSAAADQPSVENSESPSPIHPPSIVKKSSATTPPQAPSIWRSAGRSQRWQPLNKLNPARLQWAEMATPIGLFLLIASVFAVLNGVGLLWFRFITSVLRWSSPIPSLEIPVVQILVILGGLFVVSPWLLDALLKGLYNLHPLSANTLGGYSPESYRVIQRFCQQHKMPLPRLGVVPSQAPLAFTYGSLRRFSRIVVSQGLLDQLADDEIAAIYAGELGHILHWDFSLMSWVTLITQIPYALYGQAAEAGDWLRARSALRKRESKLMAVLLGIGADLLAIGSALSYSSYWLLRWSGLWLSKQRVIYSDRAACNLTGNPNGLIRALVKSAIATAQTIQRDAKTDYLLESFDLLTPVGCRSALSSGSVYPYTSLESLLAWDLVNPDRGWLVLNNSHPLMGDRLQRLTHYALHWQLEPEIDLPSAPSHRNPRSILLQGAPFFGLAAGYLVAQILWFAAQIAYRFGVQQISWLASDYSLFAGFMMIGLGIGIFLRFNAFFPELKNLELSRSSSASQDESDSPSLVDLLTNPNALPIDRQPIRLEGTLLGRAGIANWLGQDLLLQTSKGLIKLHYLSQLGAIGNLLPQATRPADLVGQSVRVTGWFRRGATPWIDMDTVRSGAQISRSGHQVWSTLLAGTAILFGLFLIV
ncbi:MAG: M48 family metalloprotease [Candidatus Parcubacteria bacterium]|nr:M48 family metalloprotease [Leptolyngbyaceae cyanobacterium LF-bin-113]